MYKTALVTGAARRLGASIAQHLAHKGYDLVLHYHTSAPEMHTLIDEIQKEGRRAIGIQGDLMDRSFMCELVPMASQALGRPLDVLVNNASIFEFDTIETADFSSFDRNMRTNLEVPFFLSQAFAKQCSDRGAIVNMIDQRVLRPTPNYASYSLAKSALWVLTQTSAMGLAPKIRVNAIAPGTILQGAHQSRADFERHRRLGVLERGADIEDILGALDYLLDADKVTGQMIAVDGGQHLIWQLPE